MIKTGQVCAVAVLGLAFTAIVFTPTPRHSSGGPGAGANRVPGMGTNLPVHFVENAGQTDARVRFHAQGAGFAFFLTAQEAVFRFAPQSSGRTTRLTTVADHNGAAEAILRLRYVDGNPNVTVAGQDRASGEVNYLLGDDSSSWRRGLSQYRGVVYRDLWPGIDMKLRTDSGALKYEFHVRPGARVSDIRLAYEGVDRLTLDPEGGLQIGTAIGVLRDAPPVAFQEIAGKRVPVASRYELTGYAYGFTTDQL